MTAVNNMNKQGTKLFPQGAVVDFKVNLYSLKLFADIQSPGMSPLHMTFQLNSWLIKPQLETERNWIPIGFMQINILP